MHAARWFVLFFNDHTRITWVCLMELKSEVSSMFQQSHKTAATQYQSSIQVLYADNSGKFINQDSKKYLHLYDFVHQMTSLYSS
jgi:hypothetical protein